MKRFFFQIPDTNGIVLVVQDVQDHYSIPQVLNLNPHRDSMDCWFGQNTHIFEALASNNHDLRCRTCNMGIFALFLPDHADLRRVGHEVFHLTHRVLEWKKGKPFENAMHEDGAYLHEYLLHETVNGLGWKVVKPT